MRSAGDQGFTFKSVTYIDATGEISHPRPSPGLTEALLPHASFVAHSDGRLFWKHGLELRYQAYDWQFQA